MPMEVSECNRSKPCNLSVILYQFKVYSIDSSHTMVECLEVLEPSTGYFSSSISSSITSGQFSPSIGFWVSDKEWEWPHGDHRWLSYLATDLTHSTVNSQTKNPLVHQLWLAFVLSSKWLVYRRPTWLTFISRDLEVGALGCSKPKRKHFDGFDSEMIRGKQQAQSVIPITHVISRDLQKGCVRGRSSIICICSLLTR